ncbi:MAG TPA: TlpA disulfide reductase family protein [Elusimicrobiota bacterium]|nr:TlpA disulfide reductase family protein [Elusimicrobiota bacterium]
MNRRFQAAVLAVLAASALSGCGAVESNSAPDFSLASRDGGTVTLSGQKGRVVLVNFWATWCASCREELPLLQALQRSRGGDRFELLAVSVDDDPAKAVPPFAARRKLDFPILYGDRKTMDEYAVRELPTSYLIGPDGSIVRRYVGPLDARLVENDILSLLNRRPS